MAKSQTTAFIVFGVMILLLGSIFFFISDKGTGKTEMENDNVREVSDYVESCLKRATHAAVIESSLYGGYPFLTSKKVFSGDIVTSLSLDVTDFLFPSDKLMKTYLEQEITKNSVICFNHFAVFKDINVSYYNPKVNLIFSDDSIKIYLNMRTVIERDGSKRTLRDYHSSLRTNFYGMYKAMYGILNDLKKDPRWLNVNRIHGTGYNVTLIPSNRSSFIIELYDKYGVDNSPLAFMAGVKSPVMEGPKFDVNTKYILKQGEKFSLYLNPNHKVEWYDDTAMFDVVDGWINFTPLLLGNFTVNVRAMDESGNEYEREVLFEVKE